LLGVSTGLVVTSAVVIPTSIMLSNQKKSKLLNRRTTKADVGMIKDEITNSYDYKIKNSYAFQSLSASEKEIYIERFDKYVNEIISAAKSVGMSTNDLVDRLGEEALEDSIKVLDYKAADKIIANMKRGILDSNLGDANK
jgi:hypothetical protein